MNQDSFGRAGKLLLASGSRAGTLESIVTTAINLFKENP